jgi:hypothetical protein
MLPDDEQIRQRAYEIWEREGRPEGREAEHWRMAADELGASAAQKAKMDQEIQEVPAARMRGPAKLDESREPSGTTEPASQSARSETVPAAPSPDPQADPLGVAQPNNKAARKRNGPARNARSRPDASPAAGNKTPDRTR